MKSSGPRRESLGKRVSITAPVVGWTHSTGQRTVGSPKSFAAHMLRYGSAARRCGISGAAHFTGRAADPPNNVTSRYVRPMPVRGVSTTSSSGGGASPLAIASSVLAVRSGLPCTA
jgi:hypothetical protein